MKAVICKIEIQTQILLVPKILLFPLHHGEEETAELLPAQWQMLGMCWWFVEKEDDNVPWN